MTFVTVTVTAVAMWRSMPLLGKLIQNPQKEKFCALARQWSVYYVLFSFQNLLFKNQNSATVVYSVYYFPHSTI